MSHFPWFKMSVLVTSARELHGITCHSFPKAIGKDEGLITLMLEVIRKKHLGLSTAILTSDSILPVG